MQLIKYPKREDWTDILQRPSQNDDRRRLEQSVRSIIDAVRTGGDAAIRSFTEKFDGVRLDDFVVDEKAFETAERQISAELKQAIAVAKNNLEKFHAAQFNGTTSEVTETTAGVFCWRKSIPIERVGLYVPGGTAPLFSTVLMLGIPARLAGCREIIICTPPDRDGLVAATVLYAARLCGIEQVFAVGGAQAVAAMAYGTQSIRRVDKIFGPGNAYVTGAKQIVSADVAIDMPAGPSEVAVLADDTCVPAFVAADLLSQAEHGPDSQVILVTTSEQTAASVISEVEKQLRRLARRETAAAALANSKAIVAGSLDEAIDLLNEYAAEHLILAVKNADDAAERVINAGSVFLGNYSCEAAGDYASGTNHTLPTAGFARSHGGVSAESFVKKVTFQKLTRDGIARLGPAIECMADAEGLDAHKRAVSMRLEEINGIRG